tara:strand:+ start:1078 stop:1608 length:531 start_codon:yes stop_codon:yes gene_type:complete
MKKTLIIQTSPHHTASTLLVNALYGLIPRLKNKRIVGFWEQNWESEFDSDIIVLKSHNLDIDWFIKHYSRFYKVYFICSERKEKKLFINPLHKHYKNVLFFDYKELNETKSNSLENIIDYIALKVNKWIPELELNSKTGLLRVLGMNEEYELIKDKPFTYVDEFYHIHGSHKNRSK